MSTYGTTTNNNNNNPTCRAYQDDLMAAISGSNVLTPCPACTNGCLIANHPTKPAPITCSPAPVGSAVRDGGGPEHRPIIPNIFDGMFTATAITPSEYIDVELGQPAFCELVCHGSVYYIGLWNSVLSSTHSAYHVIYNPQQEKAKVIDRQSGRKVLSFSCVDARKVKGYYIAFRLKNDDILELKEFLASAGNSMIAEALMNLARLNTPDVEMIYRDSTSAILDRAFSRRDRAAARRASHCCYLM